MFGRYKQIITSLYLKSSQIVKPVALASLRRILFTSYSQSLSTLPLGRMPGVDKSQYVLPPDNDIVLLECKAAFQALTTKEKLYAHHIAQGAWHGALVCLFQTSPESPAIFVLLQKLFRKQSVTELQTDAIANGLTKDEFQAFMIYVTGFYGNLGNYKSFGDTKIVPDMSVEKVETLIKASAAYKDEPKMMGALWDRVSTRIASLTPRQTQLGLGTKGITTYFSDNCDIKDAETAQEFMTEKNLSAYNTRLFKTEVSGKTVYEIRLASANSSGKGQDDTAILGSHEFTPSEGQPLTFLVTRGDYAPLMQKLVDSLAKSKEQVANDSEKNMLAEYIRSFTDGPIEAHKNGSRHWIQNKGPIIETYMGFIESYRDPYGMRGEFEGFVAMVNKEMSAKFGQLVENAEHFLPLLPWPSSYEKDKFLRPDFTSLDVLNFASSGIPAGINIPNYDDIRQFEGFKNVSLGNVLSAGYKDTKVTFLTEEDKVLYSKLKAPSFEVQVGLHELLGHGSGKLFIKNADGSFNFDTTNVHHLETGKKITTWYEHKETWDSKFAALSSSYEECRAECVGIYLCLSSEILRIFGHEGTDADDLIYINWLNMVRAGLLGLEFYTPETDTWRQAHMQARFVILRVLLEAGEGLVTVTKTTGDDGEPDLLIQLDRTKINSVGKQAIGDFLKKLQLFKSTGDVINGKAMYDRYSAVTDKEEPHFLSLRSTVLARKQPRKIFVQCNTIIKGDDVELVEYESNTEGMVKSFQERFSSADLDTAIMELIEKEDPYFP